MTVRAELYLDRRSERAEEVEFCGGRAVLFSARKPDREGPNQDALLRAETDAGTGVLAVADGAGGEASGARASAAALKALKAHLAAHEEGALRETILTGFEQANLAVKELGVGAATTLAVVQFENGSVRSYHVGDSLVLVVGQRGRRKHETIAHGPVGYAVEAGVLDEQAALHHEERHLVSNMVGLPDMRVEMSAGLRLAPRDTLLLASDGLSDNLHVGEIVEIIRKGPLGKAADALAAAAARRMAEPTEGAPSKPDDMTFILYRPGL